MVPKNSMRVRKIFQEAQEKATSHDKLSNQLKKLYIDGPISKEEFFEEFINCLKIPFMRSEKHVVIENALNFATKFLVSLSSPKAFKPEAVRGDDNEEENDDDEDEEEERISPFVIDVFKFLFKHHNSDNQTIRYRICEFVNRLLNSFGNDASLDDSLCDQITDCMMERLQDRSPIVRTQALMGLYRLQDPGDNKCPIVKALCFHLTNDPSAEVRKTVIGIVAFTAESLRAIVSRINDVKEDVRRTAYLCLSRISVQRFSINQRVRLLTSGFQDSSKLVRKCITKILLPTWLQCYKGDVLALLHALDSENSTEISTLALRNLFDVESVTNILDQLTKIQDDNHLIPLDQLTAENSLYWVVLQEHLELHPEIAENRPVGESLPEILPELTTFCKYIRTFYLERPIDDLEPWVKVQRRYIVKQLLKLARSFDLADEMGRTNLRQLCLDLLRSDRVDEDVVPILVELLVKVIPNVDERLQTLVEVISDIREPLETEDLPVQESQLSADEIRQREIKRATLQVKFNEITEERDEAVKSNDFKRVQPIIEEWNRLKKELEKLSMPPPAPQPASMSQQKMREIARNAALMSKCLRIVKEMMQSESVKILTPTLRSLIHNFVLPGIQEENDPVIRSKAMEALGIFAILDKELAKEYFVMFCFQIANDEVCEIALKTTFDLLLTYGLETFQVQEDDDIANKKSKRKKKNLYVSDTFEEFDEEEEQSQLTNDSGTNAANLISMLTSLLDSSSTSMRNCALHGFYKLLFTGRIASSALVSRLILLWYSPVTEGDESLRQPLGIFLSHYAANSPRSQETLEQAFLPTMRTAAQAPVSSPLSQIDQDSVARLFISLTVPGINKFHAKDSHIHNHMAVSLCNETLNGNDESVNSVVLLKALLLLQLSLEDAIFRQELLVLSEKVRQVCRSTNDKQLCSHIDKFIKKIKASNESTVLDVNNTANTNTSVPHLKEDDETTSLEPEANQKEVNCTDVDEDDDDSISMIAPHPSMNIIIPQTPPASDLSDDDESLCATQGSSVIEHTSLIKPCSVSKEINQSEKTDDHNSAESCHNSRSPQEVQTASPRSRRLILPTPKGSDLITFQKILSQNNLQSSSSSEKSFSSSTIDRTQTDSPSVKKSRAENKAQPENNSTLQNRSQRRIELRLESFSSKNGAQKKEQISSKEITRKNTARSSPRSSIPQARKKNQPSDSTPERVSLRKEKSSLDDSSSRGRLASTSERPPLRNGSENCTPDKNQDRNETQLPSSKSTPDKRSQRKEQLSSERRPFREKGQVSIAASTSERRSKRNEQSSCRISATDKKQNQNKEQPSNSERRSRKGVQPSSESTSPTKRQDSTSTLKSPRTSVQASVQKSISGKKISHNKGKSSTPVKKTVLRKRRLSTSESSSEMSSLKSARLSSQSSASEKKCVQPKGKSTSAKTIPQRRSQKGGQPSSPISTPEKKSIQKKGQHSTLNSAKGSKKALQKTQLAVQAQSRKPFSKTSTPVKKLSLKKAQLSTSRTQNGQPLSKISAPQTNSSHKKGKDPTSKSVVRTRSGQPSFKISTAVKKLAQKKGMNPTSESVNRTRSGQPSSLISTPEKKLAQKKGKDPTSGSVSRTRSGQPSSKISTPQTKLADNKGERSTSKSVVRVRIEQQSSTIPVPMVKSTQKKKVSVPSNSVPERHSRTRQTASQPEKKSSPRLQTKTQNMSTKRPVIVLRSLVLTPAGKLKQDNRSQKRSSSAIAKFSAFETRSKKRAIDVLSKRKRDRSSSQSSSPSSVDFKKSTKHSVSNSSPKKKFSRLNNQKIASELSVKNESKKPKKKGIISQIKCKKSI